MTDNFACPQHRNKLQVCGASLRCPAGHSYPIVGGIPRFVNAVNYSSAFGLQWNTYKRTQLDSHTGTTISRDRARRCLGELWNNLAGKTVLECGCGAGRFTEILLSQGAVVTSIDLSSAVETNAELFPLDERHRVAQADIMELPFVPHKLDVVICLGVIQHLPSPEHGIAKLYEMVKPGGVLVFDHYTWELSRVTKTAPLFRQLLKRLSPEIGLKTTEAICRALMPLHRKVRNRRILHALLSRISPVQCYYHALPQLSDELHWQWGLLDTHDSLSDWYKHLRTKGQIRRTLEALGATRIYCAYGGNGIEARAARPLSSEWTVA